MAKVKSPTDPLLEALKSAISQLPSLRPLIGPKGTALFTKAQTPLAEQALTEGYFAELEGAPSVGRGKNAKQTRYALITEAGARKVAEASGAQNVKGILESLLLAMHNLARAPESSPAPAPLPVGAVIRDATPAVVSAVEQVTQSALASVSTTIEKALGDLRQILDTLPAKVEQAVGKVFPGAMPKGVQSALGALERTVLNSLPQSTSVVPTSTDPAPILAALTTALSNIEPTIVKVAVAPEQSAHTTTPLQAPASRSDPALAEDILSFLSAIVEERTVGCDFGELFDHLRLKHPRLTIGAFHDALRLLDEAGRIRLKDWPRMQDELPRPELALFISHTVMYHVQPAR